MSTTATNDQPAGSEAPATDFDAIVVGAGFSGLRILHELRERLGLSVKVLEKASDVGGTWYWNRYPGARCDVESWAYCLFFDPELYADWEWSERYPRQEEILEYLGHIADRYELRRDIEFDTCVSSAVWDEEKGIWTLTTEDGRTLTARYFIAANGLLSVPLEPGFEGLDSFKGEWYLSGRWPKHDVTFEGKRVGVIGTGASGVQIIPVVAHTAEHLTVFQRTPNYVLPARNNPIDEEWRKELSGSRDEMYEMVRGQMWGCPVEDGTQVFSDFETDEERRALLECAWEAGGLGFLFRGFADTWLAPDAARFTQEFVHEKIRGIVEDPETAELLCPKDHHLGGKRPPLGHLYYETYNRDNVTLVDVKDNAIERITPDGVRLANGSEHELDMIIFALGFDSFVGPMIEMDIRGRDGQTIADRWSDGPQSYLGIAVDGFPNMFMMTGPQIPGGNIPNTIEMTTELIGKAIEHMDRSAHDVVEVDRERVESYAQHCQQLVEPVVLWDEGVQMRSWMIGANVEGRKPTVMFHFGGVPMYIQESGAVLESEFEGFEFRAASKQQLGAA